MQKLKCKHYYDEVYRHHYVFVLNVKNDDHLEKILSHKKYPATRKRYKELKKQNPKFTIMDCGGKTIFLDQHRTLIVVPYPGFKNTSASFHSILAHECLHAAADTLNKRGVKYHTDNNSEPLAYYLEALMRTALE